MSDQPEPLGNSENVPPVSPPTSPDQDLVRVKDRKGNVKTIPRAEYEQKKRGRKRRESGNPKLVKDILSLVLILALIIVAAYIALKIVQ
ncbi:MAG: hypothetical protein ABH878_01355 [bacterium]